MITSTEISDFLFYFLISILCLACKENVVFRHDPNLDPIIEIDTFILDINLPKFARPIYLDNDDLIFLNYDSQHENEFHNFLYWCKMPANCQPIVPALNYSLIDKVFSVTMYNHQIGIASFKNDLVWIDGQNNQSKFKLEYLSPEIKSGIAYSIDLYSSNNFIAMNKNKLVIPLNLSIKEERKHIPPKQIVLFDNGKHIKTLSSGKPILLPEMDGGMSFTYKNIHYFLDHSDSHVFILWQGDNGLTIYDDVSGDIQRFSHQQLFRYLHPFNDYNILLSQERILDLRGNYPEVYILKQTEDGCSFIYVFNVQERTYGFKNIEGLNGNWLRVPSKDRHFCGYNMSLKEFYNIQLKTLNSSKESAK